MGSLATTLDPNGPKSTAVSVKTTTLMCATDNEGVRYNYRVGYSGVRNM